MERNNWTSNLSKHVLLYVFPISSFPLTNRSGFGAGGNGCCVAVGEGSWMWAVWRRLWELCSVYGVTEVAFSGGSHTVEAQTVWKEGVVIWSVMCWIAAANGNNEEGYTVEVDRWGVKVDEGVCSCGGRWRKGDEQRGCCWMAGG